VTDTATAEATGQVAVDEVMVAAMDEVVAEVMGEGGIGR
jgi:hypothetical protein